MVRFVSEVLVLAIHDDQVRLYGGDYGVTDPTALAASLAMPQAKFRGRYLHRTIYEMAAAYGFHLSRNHAFADGNVRTAGMVMFTFLVLNGLEPIVSEPEYYATMLEVASGQMSQERLARWVRGAVRGMPPDIAAEELEVTSDRWTTGDEYTGYDDDDDNGDNDDNEEDDEDRGWHDGPYE